MGNIDLDLLIKMYISGFGTIGRISGHLEDFEGLRGITGNLDGHRRIWRILGLRGI